MLDGGALPAWFSRTSAALREIGWLAATVTVGQAFGGDLEAVTLHSGLLAARHVLGAELAVVSQGPGNLGTGTRWGFSGVASGEAVNAAAVLHGRPVASLRISEADPRERHRGVSHHSLTAYGQVALARADVVLPDLPGEFGARLRAAAAPLAAGTTWCRSASPGCMRCCGLPGAAVHHGPRSGAGSGLLPGRRGGGTARGGAGGPCLSDMAALSGFIVTEPVGPAPGAGCHLAARRLIGDAVRGGGACLSSAMTWSVPRSGWCWPMPASGSCCFMPGHRFRRLVGAARRRDRNRGVLSGRRGPGDQGRDRPEPGPVQVGPPDWRRDTTWYSRGVRRLQHEVVVLARIAAQQPDIIDGGRTVTELEDYVGSRWWEVDEIMSSTERFYPGRLPWLLPAFLAGQVINEPFERWN